MATKCINKNTVFYKTIVEQGFTPNEIAQITDKIEQEKFDKWYGKGERDSFGNPRLVKDLYLINDKEEQITLNDLLNDEFYTKRQNYSSDLTILDKIDKFLLDNDVALHKRVSAFRGTDYADRVTNLIETISQIDKNDRLLALEKYAEYNLRTLEIFDLAYYNNDKVNKEKLSKEEKIKYNKAFKNFLLQGNNFLQTFSKVSDLDIPVNKGEIYEMMQKLKSIEARIKPLQNRINNDIEAFVRDTLTELISNPEVRSQAIDFLAAQADESWTQLRLDALGDSHVTFIAAIDKFFKRSMYEKDAEVKQMNSDWDKFVEKVEKEHGDFDSYVDKKYLEKINGDKTGKFIQQYQEAYYTKLFEHVNKVKSIEDKTSDEYKKALDDYYTWKKDNTEQKYTKEYYDTLNSLTPLAREAKERIDTAKSIILEKKNLSIQDYEDIAALNREMESLKATVNPDKTKKEGDALEIANSLFKYSKAMSKFYETQGVDEKKFNKAKKEAAEKGEEYLSDWMRLNTVETFTDEFWTFFNNTISSKIPKSDELISIEGDIKQLLINFRNEKGEIKVDELPFNIMSELNLLEAKKSEVKKKLNASVPLTERKKIAEAFKKFLVFDPSSEYIKTITEKKKALEELETTQSPNSKIYQDAKKAYDRWYDANHEKNTYTEEYGPISLWTVMKPRDKKFIKTLPNNKWKNTNIKSEFLNPNFKLDDNGFPNPTENWTNEDYKNLSPEELEGLHYIQNRLLYLVEHTKNTIIHKGGLPAIPKDLKIAKKETKLSKEEAFAEKAITESDEIVKFIPFKYVKRITSTAKLQEIPSEATEEEVNEIKKANEIQKKLAHGSSIDYNLKETMKAFTKVALTNKYKTNIETDIKLFKEQLKRQKIKQTSATGGKIFDKIKSAVKGEKVDFETSAIGSNTEKHFNEWLDSVFYEDFELDEGALSNWTSKIQDFTSLRALGFNVLSTVNNKVIGNIQARIESSGGQYFNYSHYRRARMEYFRNINHFIGKHKTEKSDNYHDAFMKHFDVLISQDELSNKPDGLIKSALYKAQWVKNAAFVGQHIGEHQVQNTALLSMAYSHRIIDGKIVNFNEFYENKKIKVNFDKKMSLEELDQAYKDIDNNYLLKSSLEDEFDKFPTVFESFEIKDGLLSQKENVKLDKDEVFNFKTRVIGINQRLHGIYNSDDAATIQRYALGRLAMQFRKWMRPGWNRRFGTKFGKKVYNERVRDYEEGMYVSTFKFLSNPFISNYKEFKNNEEKAAYQAYEVLFKGLKDTFTTAKIRWHSMSEMEKANVRKTAAEFLFLIAVIAIGFLAKAIKGDDDDETKILTFTLYQADRLFGELTTFTPIGVVREGNRLFSSPSPVFNTFEDIFKLGTNMFLFPFREEEDRVFKSGIYHGQDKVGVYSKDMIPVYNQWLRLQTLSEQNQRYGLFK